MSQRWTDGRRRRRRMAAVVAALAVGAGACTSSDGENGTTAAREPGLEVVAVSTDASRVTGGDVLLDIGDARGDASFRVGDRELDARPGPRPVGGAGGGRRFLVSGLRNGEQRIDVRVGRRRASIDVVDHPIAGPVLSGPHTPMPTCTTADAGLGEPTGDDCFAETTRTFRYVGPDRKLRDLSDPDDVPSDAYLATSGPATGRPIVVEVETGVINRGIFHILRARDVEWNGRLVYRFGGGCGTTYSQGFDLMGDPDPEVLARGYAIASNTLTTFQVSCNDVVSAETAMMTKEHFVEEHGVPDVTIGEGGSGGAIQQLLIAQNYPGILDAIAPILPFPDAISISGGVLDCALLNRFYRSPEGASWTEAQKIAVNGHLTARTCDFWEQTFVPAVDPSTCGFGTAVAGATAAIPGLGSTRFPQPPADQVYDAETNPSGLRCTLQDINVNVYGRDPSTGFARRAWDNVGVQYGLAALRDGTIDFDRFLSLNERIGSHDIDGQWQAGRATADRGSIGTSYRTGRVVVGGGDLRRIPILLVNLYTDPLGDIHDRYRVFTIRDRLSTEDGSTPNLAIWTRGLPPGKSLIDSLTGAISLGVDVVTTLDEWATKVARAGATSAAERRAALDANRPAAAHDTCFQPDGTVIARGDDVYDGPGPCTDPFPVKGDPRIVAGSPRREDILKCETIPVARAIEAGDYPADLPDDARSRLEAVFPDGVCDWDRPSVEYARLGDPWQSFGD